jgi:CSLREA domain-containing protein
MGICVALLAAPASASAFPYVVTTTDDHNDGTCGADCSLRDAMNAATGADTITLPAGTYNLDPQLNELDLTGATLNGAGARTTIIDGGNAVRVLTTIQDSTAAPVIRGVTIRRGNAGGTAVTNIGGGIQVNFGLLTLVDSMVLNNTAETDGGGIGLGSGEMLNLINSTVAGNTTTGGRGGGIFSANEGLVVIRNSTISGNEADFEGGGIFRGAGNPLQLFNVTIAGNTGETGGGLAIADADLHNTIVAGNTGGQCAINGTVTANNSLAGDASCGLVGNGNIVGANPGLGPLMNNGGPTDTRAIGATSPARDAGGAQCEPTDQRGVTRPAGACDIGAYEYRAPRLTVVKQVVNDEGGTQAPGDFTVHVRAGGADVGGSPQPGTATGSTYVLAPGTYAVGENADDRYTATFSGACSATGAVTLAEGNVKTCTITNTDDPPVVGKLVNAQPERGTVKIKLPGRRRFRVLEEGDQLPVGTVVDTLKGRVTLFAAANKKGGTSHSLFYAGIFKLGQTKGSKPITVLTLVEKLKGCRATGGATTAAKKKRKRRLWGNGSGRFRTRGRQSAATVVGTKWLVEDRCTSTLTRVVRGKVRVRDFVKKKTVIVKAGKKYVAKAR